MEILVLEASTTSAKAMLYHTEDRSFEVKVRAYTGNYEDVTIHNAENVYLDMVAVGRELLDGRQVDMIALSGTWHSLVLCDGAVKPVTPVYPWSYTGAAPVCKRLRRDEDYVSRYYQKTGCMVNAIYPFFKLMMLREQGYDLSKYIIMGQGTYNNFRLTGQRVITPCLASGSGLLNTWTKRFDPELMAELGIREEQLSRAGRLRPDLPPDGGGRPGPGSAGWDPGDPHQLRRRPESGGRRRCGGRSDDLLGGDQRSDPSDDQQAGTAQGAQHLVLYVAEKLAVRRGDQRLLQLPGLVQGAGGYVPALLRRVGAGDQRLGEQPGVPPLPVRRALPRLE